MYYSALHATCTIRLVTVIMKMFLLLDCTLGEVYGCNVSITDLLDLGWNVPCTVPGREGGGVGHRRGVVENGVCAETPIS